MSRGKLSEVSLCVPMSRKPEGGVVEGVKVLGLASTNKRRYRKDVIARALPTKRLPNTRTNCDAQK